MNKDNTVIQSNAKNQTTMKKNDKILKRFFRHQNVVTLRMTKCYGHPETLVEGSKKHRFFGQKSGVTLRMTKCCCHPELYYRHPEPFRANGGSGEESLTKINTPHTNKAAFTLTEGAAYINKQHNNRKRAFTLAEVLITLGIIGIVAAMVLPTLLNKIKNAELVTAYKKVYSELSQAYMLIKADNEGSFEGLCNSSDDYYELFKKYMKNIKICNAGTASGKCWAVDWYYIGGSKVFSTEIASSSMILPSGASILFFYMSNSCESSIELKKPIGCGRLRVDLNGIKKPNTVGRDIFDFYITKEGFIPRGAELTGADSQNDWGRGAYILQTGKMDY